MEFQNLLVGRNENVAIVTINRPSQLNALNKQTITELNNCFKTLEADKEVRCIILKGAGEKAFVAGADIKEFAHFSVEQGKALSADGQAQLFDLVENLSTPVIAAVNGYALGGGLELAMACHIRVVSTTAKLGLPEVTLGVIPGYGGTQRLAQLLGKGKALELITTANMIGAEEALGYGLANHVAIPEELEHKALEIANKIALNSSTAVAAAIAAVNAGFKVGEDGFQREIEEFGKCFGTEDFKEGTTAFLEKRKPNFK